MDILNLGEQLLWIIVIVVALIVEAITLGLTSIWFAAAGFITLIISLTPLPLLGQVVIFIVLSIAFLYYLYPIIKKKVKEGTVKTNYEAVIGAKGIVTETIDNLKGTGQVKVNGQIWTGRSANEERIEKGNDVRIKEVKGVKLIVYEVDELET